LFSSFFLSFIWQFDRVFRSQLKNLPRHHLEHRGDLGPTELALSDHLERSLADLRGHPRCVGAVMLLLLKSAAALSHQPRGMALD